MHRLGNLAHPPALNPSISTSSNITLSMLPTFLREPDNPWATLYIHILPLFLGEPLRVPIEDLNALVKRHIQSVIPSSPSKALTALESDVGELISNGMLNLASRFREVDDKTLLESVVETWGFFWEQVLPYVEGALLPLQTDSMISSLSRMPKVIKPSSPSGQNGKSGPTYKTQQIDVRTIALQSFRDQIVHPLFPVLHDRLTELREQYPVSSGYQQPRLQHMLLVLVSQRSPPTEQSLTAPPPPPPPGEEAIQILLRTIRTPLVHTTLDNRSHHFGGTGAPSFLSARIPRDRRGRIAHKPDRSGGVYDFIREDDVDGGETPKLGMSFGEPAREKEREFLESLKSPGPEGARASMGGWGLGVGAEEKKVEEDDEEENLDWDQAQAVVERMVGMKNPELSPQPETSRRKLT
ncbi:hypothetical protein PHLCEN_2v11964 [Hermanssonia centrifuga]|uniref:HbrB-domain-containing protein n=1 Tax=Hermanssonia centrifuga TaxID=98765 RepID=A0A2R6NJJ7_9APHY|nr:hypothetical protein PHLCEN_2v11964 [Hermanssonia centrifuga]